MRRLAVGGALIGVTVAGAGLGRADSITPVRLAVSVRSVARLRAPLPVSVSVSADANVLDTAIAPLRIRVRLATECGGTFATTPGTTLLDRRLRPQPAIGRPFVAVVRGSGKPRSFGVLTACTFLEEEGDHRQFATDTLQQVNVSVPCTRAASRYDRAAHALRHASRARRAARRRAARAARRAARRACGPGVSL